MSFQQSPYFPRVSFSRFLFPAMKQQDSNSQDTGRLLTLQHPSLLTRAPEPACPPIQWQEEDLHTCAAAWSFQENCRSNHRVHGRELGNHVFQSHYYAQGRTEVHLDVVVFPESNSFNHPKCAAELPEPPASWALAPAGLVSDGGKHIQQGGNQERTF